MRGDSLSEFYAFVFYPLILWSIDRVIESPRAFGWLALTYGGLIMTHNVSALDLLALYLAVYGSGVIQISNTCTARKCRCQQSEIRNYAPSPVACSCPLRSRLGSGCPRWARRTWCRLDNQTTGYFNYAEHFRAANLIQNSIGFDYSIAADPQSSTPFAMGLIQAIGTGAGLIALIVTWRRRA